jgi:hypothetical protein
MTYRKLTKQESPFFACLQSSNQFILTCVCVNKIVCKVMKMDSNLHKSFSGLRQTNNFVMQSLQMDTNAKLLYHWQNYFSYFKLAESHLLICIKKINFLIY